MTHDDVLAAVRDALADRRPLELIAGGTRRSLGRPVAADATLDLCGLDRVIAYAPDELVLTVEPGVPLAVLDDLLARHGQMLAFEPGRTGTIGGAVMTGASGPRRVRSGAARDFVLGVAGVSGFGEAFRAGGRVVKNVTGYDLPRLMAGSFGTLAAVTELSLRVLPRPVASATLAVRGIDADAGCALLRDLAGGPWEASGLAWTPAHGALVRIEGTALDSRLAALRDRVGAGEAADDAVWEDVRAAQPLLGAVGEDAIVWRVTLPPADAPALIARFPGSFADWAGGLVWLVAPADAPPPVAPPAGSAMLWTAATNVRAARPLLEQAPGVAALATRVKRAFDPHAILNPGRLVP